MVDYCNAGVSWTEMDLYSLIRYWSCAHVTAHGIPTFIVIVVVAIITETTLAIISVWSTKRSMRTLTAKRT